MLRFVDREIEDRRNSENCEMRDSLLRLKEECQELKNENAVLKDHVSVLGHRCLPSGHRLWYVVIIEDALWVILEDKQFHGKLRTCFTLKVKHLHILFTF